MSVVERSVEKLKKSKTSQDFEHSKSQESEQRKWWRSDAWD